MTARDRAGRAIAALPAVGLDALTADAALLTRMDRKYIVPMDVTGALLEDLQHRDDTPSALQIDGEKELAYRSVYFDTRDLLSFHLAAYARRRRFKVRTRTYVDTGSAYLELKTRGARGLTQKERDVYDVGVADRLTPDARDDVARALEAIGVEPTRAEELDARLQTVYRRTTLLLPSGPGVAASRATIDLDLRWIADDGSELTLPRFAIVETKSAGRAGSLDRALWRSGHRPQRISKYATGMAALRPDLPRNRWSRVLSGPFAAHGSALATRSGFWERPCVVV